MEAMLLIMTFFMRHNLTKVGLVDMLKLINIIIGAKALPESHYSFMKYFDETFVSSKHYYCDKCHLYIGISSDCKLMKESVCTNCSSKEKKYFIYNSIQRKLIDIINKNYEFIIKYKAKLKDKYLVDIIQGLFMQNFNRMRNFSISFNTDGVSLFSTNLNKSFWPLIITITDLPPRIRYLKENMIVAGLCFDKNISFEVFMKPFIDELCSLFEEGIIVSKKCFSIICSALCVDSVARCKILNMKQYNGRFGCTYCTHPGNSIKIGGNKTFHEHF